MVEFQLTSGGPQLLWFNRRMVPTIKRGCPFTESPAPLRVLSTPSGRPWLLDGAHGGLWACSSCGPLPLSYPSPSPLHGAHRVQQQRLLRPRPRNKGPHLGQLHLVCSPVPTDPTDYTCMGTPEVVRQGPLRLQAGLEPCQSRLHPAASGVPGVFLEGGCYVIQGITLPGRTLGVRGRGGRVRSLGCYPYNA